MNWLRRTDDSLLEKAIETAVMAPAQIPDFSNILTKTSVVVERIVADTKAKREAVQIELARKTEELRQLDIVIAAFEPVLSKLDEEYDPAEDAKKSYEAAITAKRERGDSHYKRSNGQQSQAAE